MATAPSALPLEVSKPLPGEASRELAPLPPPLEPSKPFPEGAQDTEAGIRGHRNDRLPCCGLGIGWVLFIAGFFVTIPWYVGAVLLCCYREDKREKPGFIACTIAAVIGTIIIIIASILDVVVPN